MPLKKQIWLFVLTFLCSNLFTQNSNFNFHKIGTEDGLTSLNVFNIEQNENGVMHITTENGVYLYDGYTFNLIKTDSLNQPIIIGSSIKSANELFLSTRENGIYEFNYKTKTSFNYNPDGLKNTADNIIVNDNFIYLLTSHVKLEIIDTKNNKLIEDELRTKSSNNQAYCILKTKTGKVYIGRSNGLYELVGGKQVKLDALNNLPVYCIYENNNGELIVGSSSKIYFLNKNIIVREISPSFKTKANTFSVGGERNIHKIVQDNFGKIWFTTYPNENIFMHHNGITHDVFDELNITPLLINSIYIDKNDNIWIGTYDDGIFVIQNTFFNNINVNFAEKILSVNKILFKNNYIFIATNNGFYGFNTGSNVLKAISKPDNILMEPITDIRELNDVIYYTKRSQFDMNQSMFIDSKNKYLFKPINGKLVQPINDNQMILCDWMANVLLTNKDASKVIDTLISFPDYRININAIYCNNDSLLVATGKGLYYYNFKTKIPVLISKKVNQKINDIAIINNNIFIAHDEGIENLNKNKEYKFLGTKALNGVKKIYDKNGYIWIVSLDGLFICDKDLNPLKVFNKLNGLPSNNINDISFSDGYTCISTSKGISYTKTENLINSVTTPSPVTINYIKIDNLNRFFENNSIKLSTDQNDVSIYFYSPLYAKPNKQYYKYKINNGNWISIEGNSFSLPVLEGGKHNINIIASTDNINWSNPTQLEFDKEIKFTETQYSYWIIILTSLGIISFISYLIIKRVKTRALKRIQDEQQVNMLKHQAMNSLLSPHFIFNSLTSIQNYINSNNSLKASEYLAKFSRLIRMIIEKASQGEILLRDEITRLTYYLELEKERFKNKFDYEIKVDDALDQNSVTIPNMIIQPHAENCIIHGILPKMEHGHLHITFSKTKNKKLLITIEDNGIGLIKAKEHAKTGHKSLGTSTIKNILELNSKLTGKTQSVTMLDKSTLSADKTGTLITIELEL